MASLLDRASEASAVAAQYCEEVDRDARFPHEAVRAPKESRLLAAMGPVECGGEGASLKEIAEICRVLGQHCSATAMTFAMHQIKTASLVSHGTQSDWHCAFMRKLTRDQL